MSYTEFAVTSNFSFLRGASHPEELMAEAMRLGLAGLGLADRNSVAGVVRAHVARREGELKIRYHPGARLVLADGTPDLLAYPRDRPAWGRLCRLLTLGNRRADKGDCILGLPDVLDHADGLELVVMGESTWDAEPGAATMRHGPSTSTAVLPLPAGERESGRAGCKAVPRKMGTDHVLSKTWSVPILARLSEAAPGRVRLAAAMPYRGDDRARLAARAALARRAGVGLIAVNDVLYHAPERRPLQDVLTCIRRHMAIDAAGRRLAVNAERHLKSPAEMLRLFADAPEAIAETQALSEQLTFALDELSYQYPDETREGFATPQDALVHLSHAGARQRYPAGVPDKVLHSLAYELELIASLGYAPYFLTVHDIVRFARARGILCQGRGSAANSAVCFCLGITEVDPERSDLLFERFVSAERREPPDIDVDFEHERREEVIQHIYQRYGRERAGIAATVISYRARSAVREVGKAFGLSEDAIGAIASSIWGGGEHVRDSDLARAGLSVQSPRVRQVLELVAAIVAFPRHLSQHVGGFVITRDRLDEVMPIGNAAMEDRTFVEWDKDDLDALGILKIDVLGLGMLTCIRKAFALIERHYGEQLTLATLPAEDPAVYRMLQRADSIGVFQVESRAQMSMLPRLKPKNFYDLVIEVAIVRPGPIQGDMVHPYLRRRQGIEPVSYPSKELEAVLGKTLGVPLFQEQAMKIAIVAAGFTPSEADRLRRAMATFKRVGTIGTFQRKMIDGMVRNGYAAEFAERCFHQIEGFGEYGFPESHAASFALLVYASAWLKCRYPDAFAAALLNAQPMGFYAPAQIVRDVREHGVEVRPVDVNHSDVEGTLEPGACACSGEVVTDSPTRTCATRDSCSGRMHEIHRDMAADVRATHALRLGLREIKGLAEDDATLIVARRHRGYDSLRDLWLRTGLKVSVLERLADADAFGSLGLARRDALWAAKALGRAGGQDDLPLFAAEGLRASSRTRHSAHPPPPNSRAREFGKAMVGRHRKHPMSTEGEGRTPSLREGVRGGVKATDTESAGRLPPPPDRASAQSTSPLQGEVKRAGGASSSYETAPREGMEPEVDLPPMPLGEEVVNDYRFLKLSLRAHPAAFLRGDLEARRIMRNEELRRCKSGARVRVSGLITVRQRPGSANGVIFMTIEDETAIANVIVWPKMFERFRPIVLGARYVAVSGRMQEECGVIHVVADRLDNLTPLLARLADSGTTIEGLARCDEVKRPGNDQRSREIRAGRKTALVRLLDEMPELIGDLDVQARATRHVIAKPRRLG